MSANPRSPRSRVDIVVAVRDEEQSIPLFVDRVGADVAHCVRRTLPQRELYRRFGASAFHAISRLAFGLDFSEQNLFFRLVSTDVAKMILSEPRDWRYLRFPFSNVSGRVERIPIDTVERSVGKSKYDLPRLVMLALDGILCSLSRRRLVLLATTLLATSVALLSLGWWPVAIFLAVVLLSLVRRFREASRRPLPARNDRILQSASRGRVLTSRQRVNLAGAVGVRAIALP